MRWLINAARPARREALLRGAAIGLVVVLAALAVEGWGPAFVIVCATALVALVLVSPSLRLRTTARQEREEQFAEVAARLHHIDAEHREAQARMHAIRSIVAGIVSATELLKSLPEDRRESFASMVDAELDRLNRMLRDDTTARVRAVALDDLLGPLVTSHRSRGRSITWHPSGLSVVGRYDDVAEALNILLDNAAVHGDADDIRVAAELDGPEVTITVTDGGPGVPAELHEQIFQWGERRPGSPGEGIGLNFAQTLVRELGGDLQLDETYRVGARFVLTLPAPAELVRTADTAPLPIAG
jgi:signal transduction histidine kinase